VLMAGHASAGAGGAERLLCAGTSSVVATPEAFHTL
jgi:hypothetical protein